MRRLALELPTALQICSSHAILFHKGGVSKLAHTEIHPDYKPLALLSKNPSKRIWALIDSSPDLLEPSNIFKHFSPFFVVHVASHHSGHLDWVDEIGHKYFYMNSWSNMEVLQACVVTSCFWRCATLTFTTVAHSSIRTAVKASCGTCTRSLARLPEIWPTMLRNRLPTGVYSFGKSCA